MTRKDWLKLAIKNLRVKRRAFEDARARVPAERVRLRITAYHDELWAIQKAEFKGWFRGLF